MSDTSWDWWFGDGPLPFKSGPIHRCVCVTRYRWMLTAILGISATAFGVGELSRAAASDSFNLSSALANTQLSSFAMIVEEEPQQTVDATADNIVSATDEDELRRQRLRDLLDNDTETDLDGSNDASKLDLGSESPDNGPSVNDSFIPERLPKVANQRFVLPPLKTVSTDTAEIGNGRLPDDFRGEGTGPITPLPESPQDRGEYAPMVVRSWAAPNTFTLPLFFEDRMRERHGHERWGCMEPIAAGARFFTTIPMIPYLATLQHPCDPVYTRGYFRAGSPAPCLMQRPPLDKKAVAVEAAAIATGIIALP